MKQKTPLIIIVGPTAVGKTETAIWLAEQLSGEIVSADSRLFYRGMDIGTAKPTRQEMARIPHHLIDVADPDETWSLAQFQKAAWGHIDTIQGQGRLPFLVGGTGQYIRAVSEGWTPPMVSADPRLRAALENLAARHDPYWLHARLGESDPAAAEAIDPRNVRRTIRALEVILTTGRRFSEQRSKGDPRYKNIIIGLMRPRDELYKRVDERIEAMFTAGLLDEVKLLLQRGYDSTLPSMSGIGYRECAAVLRGEMNVDTAKMEMKRATRGFVRRQSNWFKENDPGIKWFQAGTISPQTICNYLKSAIENGE